MAFVTRSPKTSQFDIRNVSPSSQYPPHDVFIYLNDQSIPDKRIHSDMTNPQDHKSTTIKHHHNSRESGRCRGRIEGSQPHLQYGASGLFDGGEIKKDNRVRNCYNFKNIKKVAYPKLLAQRSSSQKGIKTTDFYDLPTSLKQKTMVTYRKTSWNSCSYFNQEPAAVPGPGTYNTVLPTSSNGPKFSTASPSIKLKTQETKKRKSKNHRSKGEVNKNSALPSATNQNQQNPSTKAIKEESFSSTEDEEHQKKHPHPQKYLEQEQKLFAVKYQYMNNRVFKKRGVGMATVCNRILLGKLMYKKDQRQGGVVAEDKVVGGHGQAVEDGEHGEHRQEVEVEEEQQNGRDIFREDQISQSEDDQYQIVQQRKPGPSSYNPSSPSNPPAPTFPKHNRFPLNRSNQPIPIQQEPNSPKKRHSPSPSQGENSNPSSNFHSGTQRFNDKVNGYYRPASLDYIHRPLQYQLPETQMIQESFNRKVQGFQGGAERLPKQTIADARPFYNVDWIGKRAGLGQFGALRQRREIFNADGDDGPGPAKYSMKTCWVKEHGCILKPDPKQKTSQNQFPKHQTPVFSFQSSQPPLQPVLKPTPTRKQTRQRSQLSQKARAGSRGNTGHTSQDKTGNNGENRKISEIQAQRYQTHKPWESRSFNKLFSRELMRANNMCYNKLL